MNQEIKEAIELLEDLYPGQVKDVSTEEELEAGECVIAVEGRQVVLKFMPENGSGKNFHPESSDIQASITKTRICDGKEDEVTMDIPIEDLPSFATDDFSMLDFALENLRRKHEK